MCREARRKGLGFGRCSVGCREEEKEFRGEECQGCAQGSDLQMHSWEMADFKRGWRTSRSGKERDSGGFYTW